MNTQEMLRADDIVRDALGVRRGETIEAAANRVIAAHEMGIRQPTGAVAAARAILGPGEPWPRMFRARDAVQAARPSRT